MSNTRCRAVYGSDKRFADFDLSGQSSVRQYEMHRRIIKQSFDIADDLLVLKDQANNKQYITAKFMVRTS